MEKITVETTVSAPMEHVWNCWITPQHITKWAHASDDWHAPWAENDLRKGGIFTTRMEAKDGSMGFDLTGEYTDVAEHRYIAFTMGDGRKVEVTFTPTPEGVHIAETFDAESLNSPEMQRSGWQAILNEFKKYAEPHS